MKAHHTNIHTIRLAADLPGQSSPDRCHEIPKALDKARYVCTERRAANSCPRSYSLEATCPHLGLPPQNIRQTHPGHRISENCRYIQHVLQQCLVASPCPAAAFAMFPFTNASRRSHRSNTCCVVCPGRSLIPVRRARRMLLVLSRAPGFFYAAYRAVVRNSLLGSHGDIGFAAWADGLRFNRDPERFHLI